MNTIKEMIQASAKKYPNNIAFYEKVGKEYIGITYKKLYEDLINLGNALLSENLKNKYIGVIGKNSYEWALAYLVTVCGLGRVVPLDKQMTKSEIENCIDQLEIDTIIYSKEEDKKMNKEKYNTICMQTELNDLIEKGKNIDNNYENITINSKDPAVFLLTSGTTGNSKIVMLSNENIVFNVESTSQFLNINENDKLFSILPMHHTMESSFGFLTPLYYGASIIHVDSLKNIQKDMLRTKPSVIIGVPRIIDMFDEKITKEIEKKGKTKLIKTAKYITNAVPALRKPIFKDVHNSFGGNLQKILVGGAPANPEVLKRLREYGFTVLQGYGLTECAPLVTANKKNNFKDSAVGLPLEDTEILINNPNEEGIGEVIVKGKNVMLGYYNNEEANNKVLKDGYFYTGDLGSIDKDGFLYIKGRDKNVIISSNGKNVYPEEIEIIVEKSENIKQAVVSAGVDSKGNDIVKVEIVLVDELLKKFNNNEKFKEEITKVINDFIKEVNQQISEYKRIKQVILKNEPFELTTTQKIKRYACK